MRNITLKKKVEVVSIIRIFYATSAFEKNLFCQRKSYFSTSVKEDKGLEWLGTQFFSAVRIIIFLFSLYVVQNP